MDDDVPLATAAPIFPQVTGSSVRSQSTVAPQLQATRSVFPQATTSDFPQATGNSTMGLQGTIFPQATGMSAATPSTSGLISIPDSVADDKLQLAQLRHSSTTTTQRTKPPSSQPPKRNTIGSSPKRNPSQSKRQLQQLPEPNWKLHYRALLPRSMSYMTSSLLLELLLRRREECWIRSR